uniref:Alanine racemase n=2 Tax=Lygus hesperus TaxID=30085 RepID=A0A0A9YU88_LYGHE
MSSWDQSVLVLMILRTVVGDDCRQKTGYSDSRMNQPSKIPLWDVLDTNAGLVQFYFNESYQTNAISTLATDESWVLELYHLFEMDDQAIANATFQNCTMKGTKVRYLSCMPVTCIPSNRPNCHIKIRLHSKRPFLHKAMSSQEVKWQFRYVYSGWYVLSNNNGKTVSAPVLLKTNYTKDYLRGKPLYPVIKTQNNSTVAVTIIGEALDNDCGNPMINSSCVQIELQNMQKFFIYYHKTDGIKRYCSDIETRISLMEVKWENDLYFELRNLPPKIDTTFMVKIIDTRCTRGVWNWDDKKGETCLWISEKFNVTAYDGNRTQPELPVPSGSSKIPVVFGSLAGIIGIAAIVIVAVIIVSRTRSKRRPTSYQLNCPSNTQLPPSNIFLLYARDCEIFMRAMEKFRHLLEQSTLVPVYDIWDEKRRNELDIHGDISALNYLKPENTRVKVIIVVTPVSRTIETLIIENQWPLSGSLYNEPNSLDEVFVSTFRTCIRLMHTHPERCRKFIVTRFHTIGCAENQFIRFTEPLCTIYTLPSHIHRIFGHVLEGQWDPQNLSTSDIKTFETMIEELDNFIKLNPTYEEKLLSIHPRNKKDS